MLVPYYKPPGDLGITPAEHDAFVQVLGMLERGEITDDEIDSSDWATCCVGWARRIGGQHLFRKDFYGWPKGLSELVGGDYYGLGRNCRSVDEQARVLRNYLTTGEHCWAA